MGNKYTKINVLVIGPPKSGKTFILNSLNDDLYVPKISDRLILDYTTNIKFEFKEHNKFAPPLNFKYDAIMVILRCDSPYDTILETKNILLKIYSNVKKPVCVIHNQCRDKTHDLFSYEKRNDLLQIKHLQHVRTCVLEFKDSECESRFKLILEWIKRKKSVI